MKLKEIKLNETFNGPLLIKFAKKGVTTKGSNYISLTLADSTGEISGNIWSSTSEQEEMFISGALVILTGQISEYNSKKQITIKKIRLATKEDKVDMSQLLQKAPLDANKMLEAIANEIKNFKNEKIKAITFELMKENAEEFKTHAAAKNIHHEYISGLAFHTYSMLQVGKAMCELYPVLNKDLLLAGIIIHDIGKIVEYTKHPKVEKTLDGRLRGHITIVSEMIAFVADKLGLTDSQEKLLLQHMVLSHHGLQENGWGSAVSPLTIEAEILHKIDTIDAEIEMYKKAVAVTDKNKFTSKIWGMDSREFYNHGLE